MPSDLLIASVGRELKRNFVRSEGERLKREHLAAFQKLATTRQPLPGAVELLKELKRRGIRYGIATSGKPEEIASSLTALQLDRHVVVVDGGLAVHPKPAPDPLLMCLRRLRVPAALCYLIGDSIWDLLAARRAGLKSLAVLTGGRPESELIGAGASRVFRRPLDVLEAIEELGLT